MKELMLGNKALARGSDHNSQQMRSDPLSAAPRAHAHRGNSSSS